MIAENRESVSMMLTLDQHPLFDRSIPIYS